ncbi:MAG: hypothetical protein M1298_01185 [Chloroflexi bacterium]|nr:hypothetical protein [Chloroflexota bacterium]
MNRDERADFRELLLLHYAPLRALLFAGAGGGTPLGIACGLVFIMTQRPVLFGAAATALAAGLVAALSYRAAHRRPASDFAAVLVWTLATIPWLGLTAWHFQHTLQILPLLIGSLMIAAGAELLWQPFFHAALVRFARLPLDTLMHEALREHYGDDWTAFQQKISADLREAQRLRKQSASSPTTHSKES